MRTSLDRADSASGSEEEEEDDDGFEILTAENLFSTLLSRVGHPPSSSSFDCLIYD